VNHHLANYPYCGSETGFRLLFFRLNSGKPIYYRNMYHKFESLPELVNTLRSGRIWPANVEHCPQSWTLGQTFLEKLLLIWLLSSMFC